MNFIFVLIITFSNSEPLVEVYSSKGECERVKVEEVSKSQLSFETDVKFAKCYTRHNYGN